MTQVKPCRRPVAYLAKYASKVDSKEGVLPRGLRIAASGGLCKARRRERAWRMLPRYVRELSSAQDGVKRVTGGFVSTETGEFIRSQWRLDGHAPDWSWVKFIRRDDDGRQSV